ncbi:MAG: TonB-dependent receptor, partial [Bacteroidota bacterium]
QRQLNTNWSSFADLQYRHVKHDMKGFQGSPGLTVSRSFDFINPKAGITYTMNGWQAFFSYALAQKEPNRDDFQAGLTKQPKPETLHDIEVGIERKKSDYHFGANMYYMYYYNQLVLTGQINDVGAYTRINIPHSYRLGVELQGGVALDKWINLSGNLAISKNKVSSFIECLDNYDTGDQQAVSHQNTDISFSPTIVAGANIRLLPVQHIELSLMSKYVGKQYMDNSQTETRKLNAFFVQDIRASWTIKKLFFAEWNIIGQVNNLFDKKYEPN